MEITLKSRTTNIITATGFQTVGRFFNTRLVVITNTGILCAIHGAITVGATPTIVVAITILIGINRIRIATRRMIAITTISRNAAVTIRNTRSVARVVVLGTINHPATITGLGLAITLWAALFPIVTSWIRRHVVTTSPTNLGPLHTFITGIIASPRSAAGFEFLETIGRHTITGIRVMEVTLKSRSALGIPQTRLHAVGWLFNTLTLITIGVRVARIRTIMVTT